MGSPASALPLLASTTQAWVDAVQADFDAFLIDHAACERKAAAQAMSLVVKYSDKPALIEPMIALAREELGHFHDVYLLLQKRGLRLGHDERDPYVRQLLRHVTHREKEHLLDRLLTFAMVEARSCERFITLANNLTDPDLRAFYSQLGKAEAGHYKVFIRIAKHYFDPARVDERVTEFLQFEVEAIRRVRPRAAVH